MLFELKYKSAITCSNVWILFLIVASIYILQLEENIGNTDVRYDIADLDFETTIYANYNPWGFSINN